jgi:hypothetical protein
MLVLAIGRRNYRMRRFCGWIGRFAGVAVLLAATTGVSRPAAAQSVGLFIGSSIQVDGLTFTVTACTLTTKNTAASCGTSSSYTDEITPVAGRSAIINITGVGGAPIFSVASATTGADYELAYTLSIAKTVPTSSATMTSVATTLPGSTTAITGTETFFNGTTAVNKVGSVFVNDPASGTQLGTAQALSHSVLTATTTFGAVSSLSVNSDLKLIGAGTALTLASVQQIYAPAPEPLTIGVFLVGLAGLVNARRNRRGRQSAA